jgi:hypothetical protein
VKDPHLKQQLGIELLWLPDWHLDHVEHHLLIPILVILHSARHFDNDQVRGLRYWLSVDRY